jgi:predicted nucleic acid-binding protein
VTAIVDAAPLIALADRSDPLHGAVPRVLRDEPGRLIVPAPVTAEVDYLLGVRVGTKARLAFIEDLAADRFEVMCLEPVDCRVVHDLEKRYSKLEPGLADLAIVVAAARAATTRLVTLNERHFRSIRPLEGAEAFTLLPTDG